MFKSPEVKFMAHKARETLNRVRSSPPDFRAAAEEELYWEKGRFPELILKI